MVRHDGAIRVECCEKLSPCKIMDPTSHVSEVTLFHYLIHAMPLTDSERDHLEKCSYCQSVLAEWDTYIDPGMIRAA
jgi:hypothetical protein